MSRGFTLPVTAALRWLLKALDPRLNSPSAIGMRLARVMGLSKCHSPLTPFPLSRTPDQALLAHPLQGVGQQAVQWRLDVIQLTLGLA